MNTLEKLYAVISRETGITDLAESSRFDSLGIDSLDFLSLVLAVQAEFKCDIPDAVYPTLETIADLLKVLPC